MEDNEYVFDKTDAKWRETWKIEWLFTIKDLKKICEIKKIDLSKIKISDGGKSNYYIRKKYD